MDTIRPARCAPTGRATHGIALLLLVLATAGCLPAKDDAPVDAASADDGDPCREASPDSAPQRGAVYLEVTYAADGMPRVAPEQCAIADGTRVTWRGPMDEPVDFTIQFKAAAPVMREEGALASRPSPDRRHRVQRTLSGRGEYRYSVFANGSELDPAIIIR